MDIYSDIGAIKGVGPKIKEQLNKAGIFSLLDLILYFPRDYEFIYQYENIREAQNEEKIIIGAYVKNIAKDFYTPTRKTITTITFSDGINQFTCKWFNQPFVKNNFKPLTKYFLQGKVEKNNNQYIIFNPKTIPEKEQLNLINDSQNNKIIVPIYIQKNGINNRLLIKLITEVLNAVTIRENLPDFIIKQYKLTSLNNAVKNIHMPSNMEDVTEAKHRLKFQELLIYSLKVMLLKETMKNANGIEFKIAPELKELKTKLGFTLTNAQSRSIREILLDEKKNIPMNRLLQGDVGSGKTIVALISMFNVVMNGYQTALMVPTEILAKQHLKEAQKLFKDFNINIQLLIGSTTQKEKDRIKNELKNGDIQVIIGTHTLFQDDIEFKNLGMVVTDEQHRFGVNQRAKLFSKGKNIDILVMTATPIPRTLSLYLYGDLDVSIIDELPPGRQKIDTFYISSNQKNKAYSFALKEIEKGRQVYIVCPFVEDNEDLEIASVEKLSENLKKGIFKNTPLSILHGKMSSKEKDSIMQQFKEGKIKALISTTVIEVGINIPNATLMIIENAERFGLAQLHQLRGRVGRGSDKSYCILIADMKSQNIKKRMEIMKTSNDGFYIADEDLKLRGSGELLGYRQHGEDGLILSNVIDDMPILKTANQEAKRIVHSENIQDKRFVNELKGNLENISQFISFN